MDFQSSRIECSRANHRESFSARFPLLSRTTRGVFPPRMKHLRLANFLAGSLCLMSLTSGFAADQPISVQKLVLVRELPDKYEPVTEFKPTDTFVLLVYLTEPKLGTKVKTVWTAVKAGDMQDQKLLDKEVEVTQEAIQGRREPNRVNFLLTHQEPFPAGDYKADVYVNDQLNKTIEFSVK